MTSKNFTQVARLPLSPVGCDSRRKCGSKPRNGSQGSEPWAGVTGDGAPPSPSLTEPAAPGPRDAVQRRRGVREAPGPMRG